MQGDPILYGWFSCRSLRMYVSKGRPRFLGGFPFDFPKQGSLHEKHLNIATCKFCGLQLYFGGEKNMFQMVAQFAFFLRSPAKDPFGKVPGSRSSRPTPFCSDSAERSPHCFERKGSYKQREPNHLLPPDWRGKGIIWHLLESLVLQIGEA